MTLFYDEIPFAKFAAEQEAAEAEEAKRPPLAQRVGNWAGRNMPAVGATVGGLGGAGLGGAGALGAGGLLASATEMIPDETMRAERIAAQEAADAARLYGDKIPAAARSAGKMVSRGLSDADPISGLRRLGPGKAALLGLGGAALGGGIHAGLGYLGGQLQQGAIQGAAGGAIPYPAMQQEGGLVPGAATKLSSVKIAAFVDELVKIACATGESSLLNNVVDYLTPEHEQMLKEAFGQSILPALRSAGGAIAGGAKKVVGAVQNMGAGGAAKRMAAAGTAHNAEQAVGRAAHANVVGAASPAPLKMHELAISNANMKSLPTPAPAGPAATRYNPLQVSHAAATRAPMPAPAPAPVHDPVQTPTLGWRQQLREMNPMAGMGATFRGAMQPSAFAPA